MPRPDHLALASAAKPELKILDTPDLNLEAPPHLLDDDITPTRLLFTRSTGTIPEIGEAERAAWTLTVDGLVERPQTFTIDTLKREFETVTQAVVMECAGNGRVSFSAPTSTVMWDRGAVGCARWTGVRLADVLAACTPKAEAKHTAYFSPDRAFDSDKPALSRGTPLAKATSPETMIAFEVNGEPLPRLHGGPLRIVTPGYPGAASQKWLQRIALIDREHDGAKMTDGWYRMPRQTVPVGTKVDDALSDAITDMPVKSLITRPAEGFVAPAGQPLAVTGHAWSGLTPVARVEVSFDGGATWRDAALGPLPDPFAWRRFTATLDGPTAGAVEIVARATDVAGNTQPLETVPWNPRGYCNNEVHRLRGRIA